MQHRARCGCSESPGRQQARLLLLPPLRAHGAVCVIMSLKALVLGAVSASLVADIAGHGAMVRFPQPLLLLAVFFSVFLLCLTVPRDALVSSRHTAQVHPRPRQSIDYLVGVNTAGCSNVTGAKCENGQAAFYYSQGCFIGCPTCDHMSGRRQTDLCGLGKKATLNDPLLRSVNRNATAGSEADIYRHNPWRAPGSAPVADVCEFSVENGEKMQFLCCARKLSNMRSHRRPRGWHPVGCGRCGGGRLHEHHLRPPRHAWLDASQDADRDRVEDRWCKSTGNPPLLVISVSSLTHCL